MKNFEFIDPKYTQSNFHYTRSEREEMKKKNPNLTDSDIDRMEEEKRGLQDTAA